jgi:hypothetical protein
MGAAAQAQVIPAGWLDSRVSGPGTQITGPAIDDSAKVRRGVLGLLSFLVTHLM